MKVNEEEKFQIGDILWWPKDQLTDKDREKEQYMVLKVDDKYMDLISLNTNKVFKNFHRYEEEFFKRIKRIWVKIPS